MQRQIIKIQLLASVLIFLPTLDLSNVYANSENPYANNSNSSFNKSNSSVNSLLTLFKDTGITVGGWFQAGATYNANNPGDGFNGPVSFADRADRFQLNQFNVFLERPVVAEGGTWDFGGRIDFMFGTDAIYYQAAGIPPFDVNSGEPNNRGSWDLNICCKSTRTYGIALPQAYLEFYAPVGNGLNIKAGHFFSPTGYEIGPAPDVFFYTHAYSLDNGHPFTHMGLLFDYKLTKNWSLIAGPITGSGTGGWDGNLTRTALTNWNGIAGIMWVGEDKRNSFNIYGTFGDVSARSHEPWTLISSVLQYRVTNKTHFVAHYVHGFVGGALMNGQQKDVQWIGVNTHLYYDLLEDLTIGIRGEWFRDRDGFRVPSPLRVAFATNNQGVSYAGNFPITSAPADYYETTIGLNWKPAKRLKLDHWKAMRSFNVRPNIRYDRVVGLDQPYRPFDGKKDQWLFSLDFMASF
ncbi:putative OmpL-like beta-barrel porin-2 [Nitrosospira sp. Nsp5]|uniref:Beta-barrel porin-2, OmpL-like. bbp2 n=1 Tax=Nitrosospira multiformis TaxID=1231 RepID=A0ABY0TIV1_9PROT|nr:MULTISPECIES: porin [Nitrosospira]PTR05404.1 putative OmpL-like beta-barrel porin-2 [Nitrosospira sp. Nsp5]SDQ90303.1 Putative beta-barrel porin-2, OmpL-like. bbp2 [Nitrosospira multiformis]